MGQFKEIWNGASLGDFPDLPTGNFDELKRALTFGLETRLPSNVSTREVSRLASLFLFRKALPTPPGSVKDRLKPYLDKIGRTQQGSREFVHLACDIIPRLFKEGWDIDWQDCVSRATLSSNSCTESSRKKGGSRAAFLRVYSVDDFKTMLLTGKDLPDLNDLRNVLEIKDNGKVRTVTIASFVQCLLGPLHQLIYDTLVGVTGGAILRGDADVSAKSLGGMKRSRGLESEVFVSGDYESATDNFVADHSKLLLWLIQKQSRYVPSSLWRLALRSLKGRVKTPWGEIFPQIAGQMMGNYLSFPLLCLTNLLGIFGALGLERTCELIGNQLIRINGDDIVFRCRVEEFELWADYVKKCGLTLSKGKTLVHKRVFSLNSTFFRADFDTSHLIPVLRSAKLLNATAAGYKAALGRIQAILVGWRGTRRRGLKSAALRLMTAKYCRTAGPWGSVTNTFGIGKVDAGVLGKANRKWLKREHCILHPVLRHIDKAYFTEAESGVPKGWFADDTNGYSDFDVSFARLSFQRACYLEGWKVRGVVEESRPTIQYHERTFSAFRPLAERDLVREEVAEIRLARRAMLESAPKVSIFSEGGSLQIPQVHEGMRGDLKEWMGRVRRVDVTAKIMVTSVLQTLKNRLLKFTSAIVGSESTANL